MNKLLLPVLLGTNRKDRKSVLVAKWLIAEMGKRPEILAKLFDVSDSVLPQHDYGTEIKNQFPEWRDAITKADGLIIITPEYNHGTPAP